MKDTCFLCGQDFERDPEHVFLVERPNDVIEVICSDCAKHGILSDKDRFTN